MRSAALPGSGVSLSRSTRCAVASAIRSAAIGFLLLTPPRRAHVGLNKGEAHHTLKNALRIGRQGEIRDRTTEGQHYRIAGLNLLTATIVYWNTRRGWQRPKRHSQSACR